MKIIHFLSPIVGCIWQLLVFLYGTIHQIHFRNCTNTSFLWFVKVKNVISPSFACPSEFTSLLIYRLDCKILIWSNLQIHHLDSVQIVTFLFTTNKIDNMCKGTHFLDSKKTLDHGTKVEMSRKHAGAISLWLSGLKSGKTGTNNE